MDRLFEYVLNDEEDRADYDKVRQALTAQQWQPISTAPRDGKFLVIAMGGLPFVCEYWDFAPYPHIVRVDPADYGAYVYFPQVWMPLPDTPEIEASQKE